MGHTAIPILVAVLSYCVRGNVEVRATQSESIVTAHCSLAVCFTYDRCWILFLFVFFSSFLLIRHVYRSFLSEYCLQ